MSQSYPQQGVGGMDSRYLRSDGSISLTNIWNAVQRISASYFLANSGGLIFLGSVPGGLRLENAGDEIIEMFGVSNNQANLHLKNLRVQDLSGVGNRNVIADVNGDLSAP